MGITMKTTLRITATFLLLAIFVCCVGTAAVSADGTSALTVTYTFTGDYAGAAGFAQGEITITPGTGARSEGYYLVYYADDTDTLRNYDELASVKITGSSCKFTVKSGTMIPVGATKIAVFESEVRFLDDTPALKDAAAVTEIPPAKRLTPGTPALKFGTVSDVHMDYEEWDRGAYEKWENALKFFKEQGMEYIIVTGDMTGDDQLDTKYKKYLEIIDQSGFPVENIYESIGNHGNTPTAIRLFTQYTSGKGEVHPFENSQYYSVFMEGKTEGARDNLFIFMAQELTASGQSAQKDNFSKAQIDWLEGLLDTYYGTETNIFIIEHSPFLNVGAGDRHAPNNGYGALVTFKSAYPQNMRLKGLLETHKNVIVMSGHTHLTLYDYENYSNENGKFSHTVHVGSTAQPCGGYSAGKAYTRSYDGRYEVTPTYGSEGYTVAVYDDYILYTGYNLATGKIIPTGCIIIPTHIEYADEIPPEFVTGDLNGDGKINSTDYMLLKRAVLLTYALREEQKAAADVNGDGKINSTDYMLLKRAVLGTGKLG